MMSFFLPSRMLSTVAMKKKKWHVPASKTAKDTFNPIRAIVDTMKIKPNPDKKMIALSIGDPTVFGNLSPPKEMIDAVIESVKAGTNNGYAPSTGFLKSKEAVAKFCSAPNAEVEAKDVVFASGCSNALEMAIDVLVNPGDNILLPLPGFSIYQTISVSRGHDVRFYNLLPEKSWEVDIDHMESLIDSKTRAIIVNNPSNPCGSVYTKEHLEEILEVSERHRLPIISDEVYADVVFPGHTFYPLASLSKNVPILTCGAISKRFLVPGWRLGWILIHDRNGAFEDECFRYPNFFRLVLTTPEEMTKEACLRITDFCQNHRKQLNGINGTNSCNGQLSDNDHDK